MLEGIDFSKLKMIIRNERIAPKVRKTKKNIPDVTEKIYFEEKDFRRVFEGVPKKKELKNDIVTYVDFKEPNILPKKYTDAEKAEYIVFVEDALKSICDGLATKMIQERLSKSVKTSIVVKPKKL
jgi:hypothetical protein